MTALRPTQALRRAEVLGLGLVALAVVTGRPDLLGVGLPFLAYAVVAHARRPVVAGLPRALPDDRLDVTGEHARIVLRPPASGQPLLFGAAWPARPGLAARDGAGVVDVPSAAGLAVDYRVALWGTHSPGPFRTVVADPAGAWRASSELPGPSVVRRPPAFALPGDHTLPRPIGSVGNHTSPRRGQSATMDDIRPYAPGDQRRHINWRVTARTGTPHVNSTLAERDTDVLILADTRFEVPAGDASTSLDVTCGAIAAISRHYASQGDRVAFHDMGGRIRSVPFGAGRRQASIIADALARVNRGATRGGASPLRLRVRNGTIVFYCSPLLAPGVERELGRLLGRSWQLVVVDTLPKGFGGLPDAPTGRELAFAARRVQHDQLVTLLEGTGVPVVAWSGGTSLGFLLSNLAHARSSARLGVR